MVLMRVTRDKAVLDWFYVLASPGIEGFDFTSYASNFRMI